MLVVNLAETCEKATSKKKKTSKFRRFIRSISLKCIQNGYCGTSHILLHTIKLI